MNLHTHIHTHTLIHTYTCRPLTSQQGHYCRARQVYTRAEGGHCLGLQASRPQGDSRARRTNCSCGRLQAAQEKPCTPHFGMSFIRTRRNSYTHTYTLSSTTHLFWHKNTHTTHTHAGLWYEVTNNTRHFNKKVTLTYTHTPTRYFNTQTHMRKTHTHTHTTETYP